MATKQSHATKQLVNLHIIEYKGRTEIRNVDDKQLHSTKNFIVKITPEARTQGFLLFSAISDLAGGDNNVVQFGIKTIKPDNINEYMDIHPASLVLEHVANRQTPSNPDSIRYDYDGEMVNFRAKLRPKVDEFDYGDIISAEVTFSEKTIEYFKNGKSISKSSILFEYPWYFAIWPARDLNVKEQKIVIIQDQGQLMKLRNDNKQSFQQNDVDDTHVDDSKCNNCDQLQTKLNLLQNKVQQLTNDNEEYMQAILRQQSTILSNESQIKSLKTELDETRNGKNKLEQDIGKLLDDQKELQMTIQDLQRENKQLKLANIDTTRYLEWEHEEILQWILSLEDGRYSKYEQVLKESLADEEVKGIHLQKVDALDVKGWGVKSFEDKKDLAQSIQQLVQQNMQNNVTLNEGAPTAYIAH